MRNLLNQCDEPIVIVDNKFKIKSANQTFLKVFEYKKEEHLINKSFLDFIPIKEEVQLIKNNLFKKKKIKNITFSLNHKGNNLYSLKSYKNDKNEYIIFLNEQINKCSYFQTNNNEFYYDLIINKSNVMLIEIDINKKIININNKFLILTGYKLKELLNKKIDNKLFKNKEVKRFFDDYFLEIKNNNYCPEFELPINTKDNKEIYLNWCVFRIENRYGQLEKILFICQNISVAKRLEKKLIDYTIKLENIIQERTHSIILVNKELVEANKAKDEFLQNISHELRTPLTPVLGYLELLLSKKELDDEFRNKIYNKIKANTQKLISIINDLVDLSKIELGKIELNLKYIDINKIILSSIETVKNAAQTKMISINTKLSNEELFTIADPRLIEQVLWNLLSNAIKFSNEKGNIYINSFKENNNIFIEVIDEGIGIQKEIIDKIFYRFYQADSSLTRRYGGLGIGLSIAKKYVDLHQGKLIAESKGTLKGAKFTIILPIRQENELNKLLEEQQSRDKQLRKILIIDDEISIIELFQILLSKNMYEIYSATSLKKVLKIIKTDIKFDLIFLDLNLINMNGFEAIKIIKDNLKYIDVKIIAMSSISLKDNIEFLRAEGFDYYLIKPFNFEDLHKVINLALNQSSPKK
ncbi:MAG TPA: ATP-binding protein [bacterium]|nr:ATP-binding protein [bacterium]HOL48654.1 ATP-binding protein [bacterium]HPQ19901.1 ATP-binding protein [bacterium]